MAIWISRSRRIFNHFVQRACPLSLLHPKAKASSLLFPKEGSSIINWSSWMSSILAFFINNK
uniref:Putative ovule protein n=1 Tax=Solanum chacoense TaxID=4108 RepID=A0A0V0GNC9_SOLCH